MQALPPDAFETIFTMRPIPVHKTITKLKIGSWQGVLGNANHTVTGSTHGLQNHCIRELLRIFLLYLSTALSIMSLEIAISDAPGRCQTLADA